jgi:hypothetical protein
MKRKRDLCDKAADYRVKQSLSTSICINSTATVGIERESKGRQNRDNGPRRKILVLNPERAMMQQICKLTPVCPTQY